MGKRTSRHLFSVQLIIVLAKCKFDSRTNFTQWMPVSITLRPLENSTISSAWIFLRPYTRAIPSPIDSTRPVSSSSAFGADPKILCSNIEETSAVPETQN